MFLVLFLGMILHTQALTQQEAQSAYNQVDDYFKHRTFSRPTIVGTASRGPSRFERLHEDALINIPQISRVSASASCRSNNALRTYQDHIRKINILHETRLRAFWELQADYPTCVYTWDQISQGNYAVLPYVAVNISGAAHPADWMANGLKTMPNGMIMETGMMNTVGYSHGTYCSVHPEKQLAPGSIIAVHVKIVQCEGGICSFEVVSTTATFEITLPDNTVIPSFVANLTTVGQMTFDSENRINTIQADVRFIDRLSFIDPSFYNPFNTTRLNTIYGVCYLATSVLCTSNTTSQFVPTPFDPVGSPGFVDCVTYMSSLPTGDLGLGYGRNVQCKNTHTLLAADVPFMHCPHIGKSGGGQCANRWIAGEGLDAQGNIDPTKAFDPFGIPYGPSYIDDYSDMLHARAYDPRDPVMEECLDRRANLN